MTKPENRWQLLLVADDGRIIPFKRIKGVALTLMILLVSLGLACAGLVWHLTIERARHARALEQLSEANRQAAHFKNEHELVAAELVLAEARMQKAGLPISRHQTQSSREALDDTAAAEPVPESTKAGEQKKSPPMAESTTGAAAGDQSAGIESETSPPETAPGSPPKAEPTEDIATRSERPVVALGPLTVTYDAGERRYLARFRVKNAGLRSEPVSGRCVVVLKGAGLGPDAWTALPGVSLVNGKPDGKQGQVFRISRFIDMKIEAAGETDPSTVDAATVYVFDASGAPLMEKDYPIDIPVREQPLPAKSSSLKPEPQKEADPGRPTPPAMDQTGRLSGSAAAGGEQPPPTAGPTDDLPPADRVEPVKKEDTRARY